MTTEQQRIADLIVRVQDAFFNEANDHLSAEQVRQRVAADAPTCAAVLDVLVDARVLARRGRYYRFVRTKVEPTPPAPHAVAA